MDEDLFVLIFISNHARKLNEVLPDFSKLEQPRPMNVNLLVVTLNIKHLCILNQLYEYDYISVITYTHISKQGIIVCIYM